MARAIDFKTSVAVSLSGLDVPAKKLQELCGREKPAGQHHMRYMPSDIRAARYRAAGVEPPANGQLGVISVFEQNLKSPAKNHVISIT